MSVFICSLLIIFTVLTFPISLSFPILPLTLQISHLFSSKCSFLALLTPQIFVQIAPLSPFTKLCYNIITWIAKDSLARHIFCKEQQNKGDQKPNKKPHFQWVGKKTEPRAKQNWSFQSKLEKFQQSPSPYSDYSLIGNPGVWRGSVENKTNVSIVLRISILIIIIL